MLTEEELYSLDSSALKLERLKLHTHHYLPRSYAKQEIPESIKAEMSRLEKAIKMKELLGI